MGVTVDRRPRRQRLLEARLGRSIKVHILEEYGKGVRVEEIAQALSEMSETTMTPATIWGWLRKWAKEQGDTT